MPKKRKCSIAFSLFEDKKKQKFSINFYYDYNAMVRYTILSKEKKGRSTFQQQGWQMVCLN